MPKKKKKTLFFRTYNNSRRGERD